MVEAYVLVQTDVGKAADVAAQQAEASGTVASAAARAFLSTRCR